MRGVTDCRISVGLPAHPKTVKLIRRVGREGAWSLVCLLAFASANRPDGDLSSMTVEDIEIAADWHGEEGKLVKTLAEVGFLDTVDGGFQIHDWAEHNPWATGADRRSQQAREAALARHTKGRKRFGGAAGSTDDKSPEHPMSMPAACSSDADSMQVASSEHADSAKPQCPVSDTASDTEKNLPSEGASAARHGTDPVFGGCLSVLTDKGVPERSARSCLGKLRRDIGDAATIELVSVVERDGVIAPVPWLFKAADRRKAQRPNASVGMPDFMRGAL